MKPKVNAVYNHKISGYVTVKEVTATHVTFTDQNGTRCTQSIATFKKYTKK